MKALLICPAERPGVAHLAESSPLAVVPLLGKSILEYWLESLAARRVREVIVLASDRPHDVRAVVGDGARWGVRVELIPQNRELSLEEARARYRTGGDWLPDDDVVLMDYLPGRADQPLFESYGGWFSALQSFVPHAVTPARIGVHEVQPGIWVGLHAQISATARLIAPCWIGENTLIGDDAEIGPGAIVEDRVVVDRGAKIAHSIVGAETFVGELISVQHSLAFGATVVSWKNSSCLRVPDGFFLCPLNDRRFALERSSLIGRVLAAGAMLVTAPAALAIMLLSLLRGETPLVLRLGVRPQRNARATSMQTFAYYELAGGRKWLRRWPQFWSVVRGDLNWVGNRPLRPTQALTLSNDFERLWLTAPVGLVSLGDAHGCIDDLSDETCAHASFYAVNANRRLAWFVLWRTFYLALASWPIRWNRRKYTGVALPQLAPKQEI